MGRFKIIIPKNTLEKLYWKQYLSPPKIAKIYHCDPVTVRTRMREFNIGFRSSSGARMRYRKFDFSGNQCEKAYLIGFRLGDLNIWQTSSNSELIIARCNTTHLEQIELMKKLFSKYGKVTISVGPNSSNVQCFLNRSFDFLIPKYVGVPNWIWESKELSFSFIAGYTDAEGSFKLNQKKARFKIDSYDFDILSWMADRLNRYKIFVRFHCIARKGQLRSDGLKFNSDLWRININEASSLLRFITFLEPFISHKNRRRDMLICKRNIKFRLMRGSVKNVFI